jgi:sigma-B regulation protein RsbU (phosphoserine phosphatase)
VKDVEDALERQDPWRDRDKLPVHEGGFFGGIIRQAYPQIIHDLDVRDDPIVGDTLAEFGSLMAVPLFDNGEPLNWAIMLHHAPDHFTVQDLEEAILRANLIGSTVRNVLAAQKLRAANERVRIEVDKIARIQRALLPAELPDIPGVSLGASYETFDSAGGDLYDFIPQRRGPDGTPDPNGPWGIQIADAAGHGPAAATVVAMLNAILNATPDELHGPAEMLAFANRHLFAKRLDGTFVTAILARYCPTSRQLTYARAGHNPALLMTRVDGKAHTRRLDTVGGIPLGVVEHTTYEEETIQLEPGHTVVFYTDGITEAMDPEGSMFDVEGIERSLTECSGETACVISHVTNAVLEHEAGRRPSDDQTLVVMRVEE